MDRPSYWLIDAPTEEFSARRALPSHVAVAVVGGGLMGVATAYWLARAGTRVLLLESRQLAWGASGRNVGLMLASLSLLEDPELVSSVLTAEGIDADYHVPGHLSLASCEGTWERILTEVSNRTKTAPPLCALDRSECEDLLCMRIATHFRGGRWYAGGAVIDPARFVYGLARAAVHRGAQLQPNTRVQQVTGNNGTANGPLQIMTDRGAIIADHVVYACNAWVVELIGALGRVLKPKRGQVLCTAPLPRVYDCGMAVDWGTVYWRQAPNGSVVIGGLSDRDPEQQLECTEDLNPHIQLALEEFLPSAFPGMARPAIQQRWCGVMDCTSDGRPLAGRIPGSQREWILAGFGGHGMPSGLGFAKALSESILRNEAAAILESYSPGRFIDLEVAR